jgi:hypothetical protein
MEAYNDTTARGATVTYACVFVDTQTASTGTGTTVEFFHAMGDDFVCVGFLGGPCVASGTF